MKVYDIVIETLKKLEIIADEEIDCNISLYEYQNLTSISAIQFIVEFEEYFQIEFDDDFILAESHSTIQKIVDAIENKMKVIQK